MLVKKEKKKSMEKESHMKTCGSWGCIAPTDRRLKEQKPYTNSVLHPSELELAIEWAQAIAQDEGGHACSDRQSRRLAISSLAPAD